MAPYSFMNEEQKKSFLKEMEIYFGEFPYPPIPNDIWFKGETPDWLALPDEITSMILGKLDQYCILEFVQFTCKSWYDLCKDPTMWKTIDLGISHRIVEKEDEYYYKMLLNAIDRAPGQVEAINIEHCWYVKYRLLFAKRTGSSLKRLTISSGQALNESVVDEFFRMLPRLEVFEIANCSVSPGVIEALGRYCPLLHTLRVYPLSYPGDVTYTIAENLPKLCHVFIYEAAITVQGLEVMLNSCSLLESLDLRLCRDYNTFDEDLGRLSEVLGCEDLDLRKWPCLLKRCQQIKFFRLPTDNIPQGPILFSNRRAKFLYG